MSDLKQDYSLLFSKNVFVTEYVSIEQNISLCAIRLSEKLVIIMDDIIT